MGGVDFPEEFKFPTRAHGLQSKAVVTQRFHSAPGFTIVELMVVVTIIAVVSALVLPGAVQVLRERRAQQAATSVLDIARETRTRAMYRGMAHTLVIQSAGTALRFESWEGSSSSCRLSQFGGGLFNAADRVYALDLSTTTFARDNIGAQVSVPSGASYVQICFTPLGVAFFSTSPIADGTLPASVWSNDSGVIGSGGGFVVDVFQRRGSVDGGVRRRVVIPLSGMPRMRS
jgi:prepilin-type N-terminal cleavage/methylation domain-containing protein